MASQPMPEWMNQALACLGLGLLQRISLEREEWSPAWEAAGGESEGAARQQLRERLELTALALNTGAPLSTAEVSLLLGARPGGEVVERGNLRARRLSRNVWTLSRIEGERDGRGSGGGFQDGFGSSFRRRL